MIRRSLSLAILGTRGVPPCYGGFETFAAELGTRLVDRGHRVTVYCRSSLYESEPETWNGIHRIELPAIRHKYLETVSHAFLSALDAMRRHYDAVLVCNAANAFVLPLLRATRCPVAINVDGIERQRRKWNVLGRAVYTMGEALSARYSDRLIADAEMIAAYYRSQHAVRPIVIPYGADFPQESDSDILRKLGLQPGGYVLYVSRFEPENNPLEVVRAFGSVRTDLPLVMVGDAPYAVDLVGAIRKEAARDPRVLLTGAVYGVDYRTLQRNKHSYVQATEVGGTHPALIEAMSSGGVILANDTPENREVGGETVLYFRLRPEETLSRRLQEVLDAPNAASVYGSESHARARRLYSWDRVTDNYEELFAELAGATTA